jgi:hypothetical protein
MSDDGESDDIYREPVKPFSGELNVSAWDAITSEVRRSAYRAAWIDERIDLEAKRERALMESEGAGFEKMSDYVIAVRIESEELRMRSGRGCPSGTSIRCGLRRG